MELCCYVNVIDSFIDARDGKDLTSVAYTTV